MQTDPITRTPTTIRRTIMVLGSLSLLMFSAQPAQADLVEVPTIPLEFDFCAYLVPDSPLWDELDCDEVTGSGAVAQVNQTVNDIVGGGVASVNAYYNYVFKVAQSSAARVDDYVDIVGVDAPCESAKACGIPGGCASKKNCDVGAEYLLRYVTSRDVTVAADKGSLPSPSDVVIPTLAGSKRSS